MNQDLVNFKIQKILKILKKYWKIIEEYIIHYINNFYRVVLYADSEKVDFIFDKYLWKKIKKYMGSHFYSKKLGYVRADLVFILLHYPWMIRR